MLAAYFIGTSICMAAPQKTVEFGTLVKEQLVYMGNEKIDPTSFYTVGWDQLDKSKNYVFKIKDFADEYQGTVKPLLVFNSRPAKEAYKQNTNAKWDMFASGSRAGISKFIFSSKVNDGASEEEVVASLKKVGITATKLICDEKNSDIASYQTGIMFSVYRLTSKGYVPGMLIIAGDVAAQHILLDLTIIPSASEFRKACR
jgi:hypothetical protein